MISICTLYACITCFNKLRKKPSFQAGLNPHYIHTESEAAGRYCRLVPIRPTTENSFYIQKPQTQHMIVNLGGKPHEYYLIDINNCYFFLI
jgi:hypothetical protein